MGTRFVIAVGALALDTILMVPHFPQEDSKLRAISLSKRRGGNCPNTLEVFGQLLTLEENHDKFSNVVSGLDPASLRRQDSQALELVLIAPLPERSSDSHQFINASFSGPSHRSKVNLSYCLFRNGCQEPVSSYIISSLSTGTRTIVNHNDLPEMTYEEFQARADEVIKACTNGAQVWFHFEGRIPPVTLQCMQYLRHHRAFSSESNSPRLRMSAELEKAGRDGLQALAHEADVIFYSKNWAEHEGYISAASCVIEQAKILQVKQSTDGESIENRVLACTWGDQGSCALNFSHSNLQDIVHSPAFTVPGEPIVDTVGAGDTFIAGMLFGFMHRDSSWSLRQKLDFANELAGRKVLQNGFGGLGEQIKDKLI